MGDAGSKDDRQTQAFLGTSTPHRMIRDFSPFRYGASASKGRQPFTQPARCSHRLRANPRQQHPTRLDESTITFSRSQGKAKKGGKEVSLIMVKPNVLQCTSRIECLPGSMFGLFFLRSQGRTRQGGREREREQRAAVVGPHRRRPLSLTRKSHHPRGNGKGEMGNEYQSTLPRTNFPRAARNVKTPTSGAHIAASR